jgi:hypothetical protein
LTIFVVARLVAVGGLIAYCLAYNNVINWVKILVIVLIGVTHGIIRANTVPHTDAARLFEKTQSVAIVEGAKAFGVVIGLTFQGIVLFA